MDQGRSTAVADGAPPVVASPLPGAALVARIRRLLVVAVVAGLAYATVTVANKVYCPGGFDAGGGFVDADGRPTPVAPQCIDMMLGPSPLLYVAVGIIVFVALGRVLRRAVTVLDALRILNRTTIAVGVVFAASAVISLAWFAFIPIEDFDPAGSYMFLYPFPFGSVTIEITPMPAPTLP